MHYYKSRNKVFPYLHLFLEPGPRWWLGGRIRGSAGVQVGGGTHQAGMGAAMVVEFFIFIHPHFSRSDTVGQSLIAGVGSLLGENVANVRARVCLQGPTALPDLCTEQGGGQVDEWREEGRESCWSTAPAARRPGTQTS